MAGHHKWSEIKKKHLEWAVVSTDGEMGNRRRVRVLRSLQLRKNGKWSINAFIQVEFSPRKVACAICGGTIQGNDEPRVTIRVPTGYPAMPGKHWITRADVRFHIDCLQAFLGDADLNDHGPKHYGVCQVCNHYTATRRANGQRLCVNCGPIYGEQAQKKTVRGLARLEKEYGE